MPAVPIRDVKLSRIPEPWPDQPDVEPTGEVYFRTRVAFAADGACRARELVTIAESMGPDAEISWNGMPLVRGPELVVADGVEWVEMYSGSDDENDPAFCRLMIRADARIELG